VVTALDRKLKKYGVATPKRSRKKTTRKKATKKKKQEAPENTSDTLNDFDFTDLSDKLPTAQDD